MGNFSHFPHPAVWSFMLYAQCDVKTRRTFFFPLLSGGKYQLELCEQWVIHLAQDQGNCHLKTFHSPIILQLRSLRVQMDRRREMPLWALTHRTSPTVWAAWLCQLSLSPLCLAHAQMFDLRMISSQHAFGFSLLCHSLAHPRRWKPTLIIITRKIYFGLSM